MSRERSAWIAIAWTIAWVACVRVALAGQEPVTLDPSARSGAMGGASVAVPWGGTPNVWANPALAAAVPGVSLQAATQLFTPGEPVHASLAVTRFTLACAGLAWTSAGRPLGSSQISFAPFSMASLPVDYGWPAEGSTQGDGIAFSGASFADAVGALVGHRSVFADRIDFAWGRQWQRVQIDFPGSRTSVVYGEGWLARLTPIDTRRGQRTPEGGTRVEVAYGNSTWDTPYLGNWYFSGGLGGEPTVQQRRDGGALRIAWFGPQRGGEPGAAFTDAFRGALAPLIDLTLTAEHQRTRWLLPGAQVVTIASGYGAELTVLRALALRYGDWDNAARRFNARTWGWGLTLPLGRDAEVRYDFASVPRAGAPRIDRHVVTVRVDPLTRWLRAEPRTHE